MQETSRTLPWGTVRVYYPVVLVTAPLRAGLPLTTMAAQGTGCPSSSTIRPDTLTLDCARDRTGNSRHTAVIHNSILILIATHF